MKTGAVLFFSLLPRPSAPCKQRCVAICPRRRITGALHLLFRRTAAARGPSYTCIFNRGSLLCSTVQSRCDASRLIEPFFLSQVKPAIAQPPPPQPQPDIYCTFRPVHVYGNMIHLFLNAVIVSNSFNIIIKRSLWNKRQVSFALEV